MGESAKMVLFAWPHNPADLEWFKECTTGGVVAMG